MTDSTPLTLFIPLGDGRYGTPGLTLRAETLDELLAVNADLLATEAEEKASKLDRLLDDVLTINAGVALKFPKPVQAYPAPVSHPQASNVPADAPVCAHGSMKYREGTVKQGPNAGNPYKGWFCQAPRGTEQCKPQFINK